MLSNIQSINIEDIPDHFSDEIWNQLPRNGGNVISVQKNSDFGKFLNEQGFIFTKGDWLVVFR